MRFTLITTYDNTGGGSFFPYGKLLPRDSLPEGVMTRNRFAQEHFARWGDPGILNKEEVDDPRTQQHPSGRNPGIFVENRPGRIIIFSCSTGPSDAQALFRCQHQSMATIHWSGVI